MFSKTSDPTSAPAVPAAAGRVKSGSNANSSVLGADLKITGEVISAGTIEILGEIDGNITADQLTIGSEGRVSGSVRANTIEVRGRVEGKVDCDSFIMRAASVVTADVTYASLSIESGATIEGRFIKVQS